MTAAKAIKPTPSLIFRPCTNDELRLVKKSWRYAVPSGSDITPDNNGDKWVGIGLTKFTSKARTRTTHKHILDVSAYGWHKAHALLRDRILASNQSTLFVAALSKFPDEAVGWGLMERTSEEGNAMAIVWWIHVVGEARGQGIGTEILRKLLAKAATAHLDVRPGQMTARARAWWDRVLEEGV